MYTEEHNRYSEIEYRLKDEKRKLKTLTFNQLQIAQKVIVHKRQPTPENILQLKGIRYMLRYRSECDLKELIDNNELDIQTKNKRAEKRSKAEKTADLILNWLHKVCNLKLLQSKRKNHLKTHNMYQNKKKTLFNVPVKQSEGNAFVQTAFKKSNETRSENGALKYKSTGNDFVDQFGKLGMYRQPRSFEQISNDMHLLWSINRVMTVVFTFFIRLISRITSLWDGTKTKEVQKGAGLKHEGIMRMLWLHANAKDTFWKNIKVYISIGSWKDIFEFLRYDLEYHGWEERKLDWNKFGALIMAGLENPNTSELVKKYLPQIQTKSKCTTIHAQANTIIGKWLSNLIFGKEDYKSYRKLKSSGKAHEWQQLISKRLFNMINFDTIHGRALLLMVSGKFITNNGLEAKYEEWIKSKPVAKFTGYVHELAMKITHHLKDYQKETINKQFDGLVELAKLNVNCQSGLIVVRDTSGSMASQISGQKVSAGDVAKAMGLFFSQMLIGPFKNAWIEFNSKAQMNIYKGHTFIDKWLNDYSNYYGSTNFMDVVNVFINTKKQGIAEDQFPTGIICISDGEFNPAQLHKTNVDVFRSNLRLSGFSQQYCDNFKIILWNVARSEVKFETFGNVNNVYYLSGYDGSILGFLLGNTSKEDKSPQNAEELFKAAMNQEVLNTIEI